MEGIRAVAVLMVVLFHAGVQWAVGGYLGVDVFLVISGYLIIGHLANEASRTGTIALVDFWARRSRRLVPAATVVIIATLLISALVASPSEFADHAKSGRAAAVYLTNFLFLSYGNYYFRQAAAEDPFLHTWSLALEEQFYLVVAPSVLAIAWLASRRRASVAIDQASRATAKPLVIAFCAVTAGS